MKRKKTLFLVVTMVVAMLFSAVNLFAADLDVTEQMLANARRVESLEEVPFRPGETQIVRTDYVIFVITDQIAPGARLNFRHRTAEVHDPVATMMGLDSWVGRVAINTNYTDRAPFGGFYAWNFSSNVQASAPGSGLRVTSTTVHNNNTHNPEVRSNIVFTNAAGNQAHGWFSLFFSIN